MVILKIDTSCSSYFGSENITTLQLAEIKTLSMKPKQSFTLYGDRYLLQEIHPIGADFKVMDRTFTQSRRRLPRHRSQSPNRRAAARGRGKSVTATLSSK